MSTVLPITRPGSERGHEKKRTHTEVEPVYSRGHHRSKNITHHNEQIRERAANLRWQGRGSETRVLSSHLRWQEAYDPEYSAVVVSLLGSHPVDPPQPLTCRESLITRV